MTQELNKSLEDENIVPENTGTPYKSISQFFKTLVEGSLSVNYDEFFEMLGSTCDN